MLTCRGTGAIMFKGVSVLLILGISALIPVSSQQAGLGRQSVPSHVVPLKQFPLDRRFETVSGDPTQPRELYVIRIHAEPGYVVMPHTHPEDEHIVVVKGSWAVGMGDHFNSRALEAMDVGAYALVPKKMAHFAFSRTETIVQVHGIGPFTTHWVVPMYELTDQGVLLETSAAEPGRPTPMSPPGCFDLKLGTRVRSSVNAGVVVAAQCTPGQLTQYRIERPDRERFWAQRDELSTL